MNNILYPVRNLAGRWGYIDHKGALQIDYQFVSADRFSEGMASVELPRVRGYINSDGEWQFSHEHALVGSFSSGLAMFQDKERRVGYINRKGAVAIQPQFDGGATFSGGVAVVRLEKKFGLIGHNGAQILRCCFDFCHSCLESEKFTSFKQDGKWGLVSVDGQVAVSPRWEFCHRFSEGLVPVRRDGKWGFADLTGEITVEPRFFDTNYFFREDRIGVTDGKEWWFVDHRGRPAGLSRFTYTDGFTCGLAGVCIGGIYEPYGDAIVRGGAWGYVDHSSRIVIAAGFDQCGGFEGELARVEIRSSDSTASVFAYVSRKGNIVWRPSPGK